MDYLIVRYLHFIAIFFLAGALVIENMAIKSRINGEDARNLAKVDAVYGISAVGVLLFGLLLWFQVGKPPQFYSGNPLFHAKIGLFVLMALLSIYPTLFFLKHRRSKAEAIEVPAVIPRLLRTELALLVVIPVLAYLMARGIGIPA